MGTRSGIWKVLPLDEHLVRFSKDGESSPRYWKTFEERLHTSLKLSATACLQFQLYIFINSPKLIAKSMYWSEACTLRRQGTRLAPAQLIAEQV